MTLQELRPNNATDIARAIGHACKVLPDPAHMIEFGAFFDPFAGARIVLLGEASHGTAEFYQARAAITRSLVEHYGFNIVAVEADWPDAERIDRYVRHREPRAYDAESFVRFPEWMWRNAEFEAFVSWMRAHNETVEPKKRVEFRGLDIYSLHGSVNVVLNYLQSIDPEEAARARERYACVTPWQERPARYVGAIRSGVQEECESAVVAQLQQLLERELDYCARDGEEFFDAAQNARIVATAEHYYRAMYRSSTDSWNLRDRHMFETLQSLMAHRPKAKAVVWAHNSHVGNAAATAMGWDGQFNIGELVRVAYDDDAMLVGFGTDRGTVAAADDWDGPMYVKSVNPSRPDSYERVFRQVGLPRSLTDLRGGRNRSVRDALSERRLERAIGVIYRPETEFYSHYFEAILPEQFDCYIWFEETRAVTAISATRPQGVPETYPFGL
ncbi:MULTISPECIES: erythromycin esterase family protein [unclassified Sinorhizobium]|uniref:erythromycin esterase family protein n=1 Tax=unclassified Sinorhizobium TaxID=2613772 RepID=UPI00352567E6